MMMSFLITKELFMIISNNRLDLSDNFFLPDTIKNFSQKVNQSVSKTHNALRFIVPEVFKGIVDRGSSVEGASKLLAITQDQGQVLSESSQAVKGVFGSNLNAVISRLMVDTGLNANTITKLLSMITPVYLGVLAARINREQMTPSALREFLAKERSKADMVSSVELSNLRVGLMLLFIITFIGIMIFLIADKSHLRDYLQTYEKSEHIEQSYI
jgi:Bacterial protein of unknown function (DUF937)